MRLHPLEDVRRDLGERELWERSLARSQERRAGTARAAKPRLHGARRPGRAAARAVSTTATFPTPSCGTTQPPSRAGSAWPPSPASFRRPAWRARRSWLPPSPRPCRTRAGAPPGGRRAPGRRACTSSCSRWAATARPSPASSASSGSPPTGSSGRRRERAVRAFQKRHGLPRRRHRRPADAQGALRAEAQAARRPSSATSTPGGSCPSSARSACPRTARTGRSRARPCVRSRSGRA